ncbi:hypothetical protein I7I51_03327, partial [Histoplasma capsulatum]
TPYCTYHICNLTEYPINYGVPSSHHPPIFPVNPKPPKSDVTARELNSERIPRLVRRPGGWNGAQGEPEGISFHLKHTGFSPSLQEVLAAAIRGLGTGQVTRAENCGRRHRQPAYINQFAVSYSVLERGVQTPIYCPDDGWAYHMIPPRPALPRPTDRLGIGDEMPRQAPRSPPRPVSYWGGWSGIGNVAD